MLEDERFGEMFRDRAFQVDTESEEYKLLNPLVTKLDKGRRKREEEEGIAGQFEEVQVRQAYTTCPVAVLSIDRPPVL